MAEPNWKPILNPQLVTRTRHQAVQLLGLGLILHLCKELPAMETREKMPDWAPTLSSHEPFAAPLSFIILLKSILTIFHLD